MRRNRIRESLLYSSLAMHHREARSGERGEPHGATDVCRGVVRTVSQATHQRRFLDEMNRVVLGADLVAAIVFVYPKADGPGRPLVGIKGMLRRKRCMTCASAAVCLKIDRDDDL